MEQHAQHFVFSPNWIVPEDVGYSVYLQFIASLTDEERAVVDTHALALTHKLVACITTHSQEHPDLPNVVWLHSVSALFEAMDTMVNEGL